MTVITEATLRTACAGRSSKKVVIEPKAYITQTARDYIREKGLEVVYGNADEIQSDVSHEDGPKPEHMTHLHAGELVSKSHSRIELRGKLDSLQARIIEVQLIACKNGKSKLAEELEELLVCVRQILACEVKQVPFGCIRLFGLEESELREMSHNPQNYFGIEHILPSYQMGETMAALNSLRTNIREVELCAVRAFQGQEVDLIRVLNRLSSGVYIIMCRTLTLAEDVNS